MSKEKKHVLVHFMCNECSDRPCLLSFTFDVSPDEIKSILDGHGSTPDRCMYHKDVVKAVWDIITHDEFILEYNKLYLNPKVIVALVDERFKESEQDRFSDLDY